MIPFNKPFLVGKELHYIAPAVAMESLSGYGHRAMLQLTTR